LRVVDIFRIGPALNDLVHRLDRAARFLLVLRHVANLPEIGKADDVLRVGRVGRRRIELHVALAAIDRLVVIALPIVGEGAHHHRLAGIFRIGMLRSTASNLRSLPSSGRCIQVGEALIVELVGRIGLLDIGGEIDVFVDRTCWSNQSAGNRRENHGEPATTGGRAFPSSARIEKHVNSAPPDVTETSSGPSHKA
jgi:hypothetical protein